MSILSGSDPSSSSSSSSDPSSSSAYSGSIPPDSLNSSRRSSFKPKISSMRDDSSDFFSFGEDFAMDSSAFVNIRS
jgi:hypothetical protein